MTYRCHITKDQHFGPVSEKLHAMCWKLKTFNHTTMWSEGSLFLSVSVDLQIWKKKIIWWHLFFVFLAFRGFLGFFFPPLFWIIVTYFNVILLVHSKTFIVFVLSKVPVATRLPKVAYHVYRNSYFVHLPKAHLALSQVFLKFNLFISIQKPLNTWVYIYIYFFRYKKNRSLLPTKHTSLEIFTK